MSVSVRWLYREGDLAIFPIAGQTFLVLKSFWSYTAAGDTAAWGGGAAQVLQETHSESLSRESYLL